MAAIDAIVFATAAGFAVIVVATILVIIGVHQEERRKTLAHRESPTVPALLARRVLRTYIDPWPETDPAKDDPEEASP